MIKKNKGNVLIIVLFILLLLATMGITFISLNILEIQTTSTISSKLKAELAAEAGIQYAIHSLQETFSKSIDSVGTSNWWCYKTNNSTDENIVQANCALEYDNAAPEYSLDRQEQLSEDSSYIPSYSMDISKLKNCPRTSVSGFLGTLTLDSSDNLYSVDPATNHPYTLKIVDTTSQFPLNTHATQKQIEGKTDSSDYGNSAIPIVGKMLNTLSKEVAKISGDYGANDDPLHGLGQEIIRRRNQLGGFKSKYDLLGKYGEKEITLDDLSHIWNYITVYPTWEDMKEDNIYRQVAPIDKTEGNHRIEYRCPVNINTASFPVLMAVLTDITYQNGTESIVIDNSDAFIIAKTIINLRKNIGHFTSWESFEQFLNVLKTHFKNSTDDTILKNKNVYDMIVSNFDPNIHLKGSNPNRTLYKSITKLELTSYTTEFCFFPLGSFDITSLGEVYDSNQSRTEYAIKSSLIHIYDTLYQTSQYDFEGAPDAYQTVKENKNNEATSVYNPEDFGSRMYKDYEKAKKDTYGAGYNGFTIGNYTLKNYDSKKDLWDNCSQCFGYIMPLAYKTGSEALDTHVCFPGNENNTVSNSSTDVTEDTSSKLFNTMPSELTDNGYSQLDSDGIVKVSTLNHLFSDGIYLKKDMKPISYKITENNFPKVHFPILQQRFLAQIFDVDGSDSNSKPSKQELDKIDEDQEKQEIKVREAEAKKTDCKGTICFWFKLAKDSATDTPVTVFFSDQYDKESHLGIQRQITFDIKNVPLKDVTEDPEVLRKVVITFENKIYYTGKKLIYNLWTNMPYYVKNLNDNNDLINSNNDLTYSKKTIILAPENYCGIHAQEWYHLAVRWHNGLQLNNFVHSSDTANENASIAICGNFYDSNDKIITSYSDSNDSMAKLLNTYILTSQLGDVPEFTWVSEEINPTHTLNWIDIPTEEYEETNNNTGNTEKKTRNKYGYQSQDHYNDSKIDDQLAKFKNTLKPLNETGQKTNRFYIGNCEESNMPQMTLDDFRIANEAYSTIDHKNYFPSRFPKTQNIHGIPCSGVFQGKMASKKTGTITSFSWTNRTDGTIKPGYSLYVIKNEELASSSTTENYTDYNELFKNFWAGVWSYFFDTNLSYDDYNSSEYTSWTPRIVVTKKETTHYEWHLFSGWRKTKTEITYEKRMHLDVDYNGKKYTLEKKFDENKIKQEEKEKNFNIITNNSSQFLAWKSNCKISEYQCYPTNSSSSYSSLKALLDDWVKNYATEYQYLVENKDDSSKTEEKDDSSKTEKELADIKFQQSIDTTVSVIPLDAHNKPYVFDDKNKTFVYEILFPASTKEESSIFNGPAVDDVTLIYMLDQPKLIEYYSDKIQPTL